MILDDDGNATFVFKGSSCAAGPSAVIADVQAGSHPTYVTTFTVAPPAVTLASTMKAASDSTNKNKKAKAPKTHPGHHKHGGGSGGGTGSATGTGSGTSDITVDASPNPLVLTGLPLASTVPTTASGFPTLTITKTDNTEGGSIGCESTIVYTITVTNLGPTDANGVLVSDILTGNPGLEGDSFTAVAGSGSPTGFTASATGTPFADINDTVDLPAGSSIIYTVTATVGGINYNSLSNTATLDPAYKVSSSSVLSATDTDNVDCS